MSKNECPTDKHDLTAGISESEMALNLVPALSRIQKTRQLNILLRQTRQSHTLKNGTQLGRLCPRRETITWSIFIPVRIQTRGFKVSDPRRALHPLIILLLRPVTKFLSVIFGIIIKRWWRKLSPEEKKVVLENISRRKVPIAATTLFTMIVCLLYYRDHIVETPLTKRKRFVMIDDSVMKKIAKVSFEAQLALYRSEIVPTYHPFYQRTARVSNSILRANNDLPQVHQQDWSLVVVDRPEIVNAFCLPNGKIFVFTGILNVCTNDDQLAIVLSHEISHTILNHVAETMSKKFIVEAVLFIPSLICWVIFADLWALMSEFLTKFLSEVLIQLPFSRAIEREADWVGLYLAARSCFDVREALGFWYKMNVHLDAQDPVEWLSTHPSYETRQDDLKQLLPTALQVRSKSNCPNLRMFSTSAYLRHLGH